MNDILQILDSLSPEKKALLELKLKQNGAQYNIFPLSFAQKRLWFLNQLEPESTAYNIPSVVKLTGKLNLQALGKSINEIIRRHEILRTVFRMIGDSPLQIILPFNPRSLNLTDLSNTNENDRESKALELIALENEIPFDLAKGPLIKTHLYQLSEESFILCFLMHHIVADGWSIEIFIHELGVLYDAYSQDLMPELPRLSVQYADYSVWQKKWLEGEIIQHQMNFWKCKLKDLPEASVLPGEHLMKTGAVAKSTDMSLLLPLGYINTIKDFSHQQGVTNYMVYLAILYVLLYRHSSQRDICIGTPVANRNRSEIEPLIGFFVNTVVLRSIINEESTFEDYLKEIKQTAIEAYANQDLPFEKLVEEFYTGRDLNTSPFFRIMYVHQNPFASQMELPGLKMTPLDIKSQALKYDMVFSVTEDSQKGIKINFSFNRAILNESTIGMLLQHYQVLLDDIISAPQKKLFELSILPVAEANKILYGWNNTHLKAPDFQSGEMFFHKLFEHQALITPDNIAVVAAEKQLSFSELNQRANRIAHSLIKMGVKSEDTIGICMGRTVDLMAGILGIMKAGGAYLPFDPVYPKDRIAFILEDAGANYLITEDEVLSDLPETNCEVICLDKDWEKIDSESSENPAVELYPENAAYIIYTSGSTGKPKGAVVQHNSLFNLYLILKQSYLSNYPGRTLKVSLNSTIMFDASVIHLVFILSGHTLYIIPEDVKRDSHELAEFIIKNEIDEVDCVPSMLKLLIAEKLFESQAKPLFVLSGGEAIDEATWKEIGSIEGTDFYNNYGPTECTVEATMCRVNKHEGLPSIGRALANVQVYILDKNLQVLPSGVTGEIYIGGKAVGRGYINRPELTAEKFIPDPFGILPGARLYRTGDLARFNSDGTIEFIGRIDHQVKIRGFRIELGEIESVLLRFPEIKHAIVTVKETSTGKFLAGYIASQNKNQLNISEIKDFLGRELPYYMIPSKIIQLDSMPLLPSGKIDRKSLPDFDKTGLQEANTYLSPKTPEEEIISGIMASLLNLKRAGRKDNFFELGGHSLLATQLKSRIKNIFNVDIPLRMIFENSTVELLAEKVSRLRQENSGASYSPILPAEKKDEIPLSYAQERLWFLEQLEPGSANYNIPAAFKVEGKLYPVLLEKSIDEVLKRHEILRMQITTQEGKAVQRLKSEIDPLKITFVDLRDEDKDEQDREIKRHLVDDAKMPFDLQRPPFLRMKILQIENESCIIVIVMHHIISDGWSMGVFVRELMTFYHANLEEKQISAESLKIQYSDYSSWQKQESEKPQYKASLAYWKNKLSGSTSQIALPKKTLKSSNVSSKGSHLRFSLGKDISAQLNLFCRSEEVTLFMLLLAAFKVLLHKYSQQNDISIGTTIANRNSAETEDLIGFFVNTLVLRDNVDDSMSFRAFLKSVKSTCLDAYAHQGIPFEKVVDEVQPVRNTSQSPLFQVMFILQNNKTLQVGLPGIKVEPLEFESGISLFDMTLVMEEYNGELGGAFEYCTDLFDESMMECMTVHFRNLISEILKQPAGRISKLSIITDEEIKSLEAWGRNQAAYDSSELIHSLVELQVKRTPGQTAVIYDEEHLTYSELNNNANSLANFLIDCGAKPGMLIGISLERSLGMITALLAILKAGCAYVPLDTDYPVDRLSYMIETSGLKMIITQSSFSEKLASPGRKVICLDAEKDRISSFNTEDLNIDITQESLAYVIFTSGSTGKPKGVMVRHNSVVNHNSWIKDNFELCLGEKVLQFSTINFDSSIEEIFPALQSGATVVLRKKGVVPSVQEILELVRKQSVTVLDIPTSYWHEMVSELYSNKEVLPESVRLVVVGGDKVNIDKYKLWLKIGGVHVKFLNTYGPTETTIISTSREVSEMDHLEEIPIGRPISGTYLYVLDRNLQLVPPGIQGELFIGGIGVSNGYIGQPELSAEKFIPDPFDPSHEKRMYRTGDLVRYTLDGELQFTGRIDNQVKIRGFRVELGEIEEALFHHPDINNAVVIARENHQGAKQIIAYYQLNEGSALESENSTQLLRGYLKSVLPEYMIPAIFYKVEKFTLMPNGKINRQQLPEPVVSAVKEEDNSPRDEKEHLLLEIWKEVLGNDHISTLDNFFEIGGDSIIAIQVVAKAKNLGFNIEPIHIFQHQTIKQLAMVLTIKQTSTAAAAEEEDIPDQIELTPIQKWFFEQDFQQQNYWNQSVINEIKDKADGTLLKEAVKILLGRHDMLRARFQKKESWEYYFAPKEIDPPLEILDYSGFDPVKIKSELEARGMQAQQSLDIEKGPVIRFVYFRMPESNPDILLVVCHHLVIDVVSWKILLEDLQEIYKNLKMGIPAIGIQAMLPEKSMPYAKWSRVLKGYADKTESLKDLSYWLEQSYEKASPMEVDFIDGPETEEYLDSVFTIFETEGLLQQINQAKKNQNAHTTDLLLASFVRAYSVWSGKRSVMIDLEGHGREQLIEGIDHSRTIGWFTSVYPVMLDLKSAIDPISTLQEIKLQLHSVPRNGIPFAIFEYMSAGEISRKLKMIPQREISFNFLGQMKGLSDDPSKNMISVKSIQGHDRGPLNKLNYKLNITALISENTVLVQLSYGSRTFRKETIQKLSDQFSFELRSLIELSSTEKAGSYTASDFTAANISQKQLNKVLNKLKTKSTRVENE